MCVIFISFYLHYVIAIITVLFYSDVTSDILTHHSLIMEGLHFIQMLRTWSSSSTLTTLKALKIMSIVLDVQDVLSVQAQHTLSSHPAMQSRQMTWLLFCRKPTRWSIQNFTRWHRWHGLVHLEDGVSGTLHWICFSFMDKFCVFLHSSYPVSLVDIHYSLHSSRLQSSANSKFNFDAAYIYTEVNKILKLSAECTHTYTIT